MRTAVFKLCGHVEIGPMGVLDQSNKRIRSPSSPPAEKTCLGVRPSIENTEASLTGGESGCALRVVKKFISDSDSRKSACRR